MATLQGKSAITTLAAGDHITVHDASSTTEDAAGDLKKITYANLSTELAAEAATLTNKTINTASNTITVVEADISDLGTYQVQLAEGAFVDGDKTKLDAIEASADVTDATNVASAGAVMADGSGNDITGDLVFTEKADHSSTPGAGKGYLWTKNTAPSTLIFTDDAGTDTTLGAAGGGISNVVEDTTPQLGGALDGQGNDLNNMGVLFLTEQAAAEVDVAGKGQFWVQTATPNLPMFTDDAGTDAEILTDQSGSSLTDTAIAGGDSIPFFDVDDSGNAKQRTMTNVISDLALASTGANTFTGTQDFNGQQVEGMLNKVVTTVTGTLTTTAHSGNILETSGNVTVPTTAGFNCILIAGGAHTVTFNATTSAAMATGDIMTLFVEDATTIHAVLTAAADKVSFT